MTASIWRWRGVSIVIYGLPNPSKHALKQSFSPQRIDLRLEFTYLIQRVEEYKIKGQVVYHRIVRSEGCGVGIKGR
jgi:hypothetical protein